MDFAGCVLLTMYLLSVMADIIDVVHDNVNISILIPVSPPVPLAHSEIILICVVLLMLFALTVTVYFLIHKTVTAKKLMSHQPDPGTMGL